MTPTHDDSDLTEVLVLMQVLDGIDAALRRNLKAAWPGGEPPAALCDLAFQHEVIRGLIASALSKLGIALGADTVLQGYAPLPIPYARRRDRDWLELVTPMARSLEAARRACS